MKKLNEKKRNNFNCISNYYDHPRTNMLYLYMRIVSDNSISTKEPIEYNGNYNIKNSRSCLCSFRPVFILKEEAKITSGKGTTESPYILEL